MNSTPESSCKINRVQPKDELDPIEITPQRDNSNNKQQDKYNKEGQTTTNNRNDLNPGVAHLTMQ